MSKLNLKFRKILEHEEFFDVNGNSFFKTDSFSRLIPRLRGWVVYDNNHFNIACIVVGTPGNWFLSYYHETKGKIRERIMIPRAAIYRIAKIIEDNPII